MIIKKIIHIENVVKASLYTSNEVRVKWSDIEYNQRVGIHEKS